MIFTKYLGPDVYSPSETRKLHRLPVNGRGKNIIYLEALLLLLFIIIIYLSRIQSSRRRCSNVLIANLLS